MMYQQLNNIKDLKQCVDHALSKLDTFESRPLRLQFDQKFKTCEETIANEETGDIMLDVVLYNHGKILFKHFKRFTQDDEYVHLKLVFKPHTHTLRISYNQENTVGSGLDVYEFKQIDLTTLRQMLSYCVPNSPNTLQDSAFKTIKHLIAYNNLYSKHLKDVLIKKCETISLGLAKFFQQIILRHYKTQDQNIVR